MSKALELSQLANNLSVAEGTDTVTLGQANIVLSGNLQVDGTSTTLNTSTLTVDDLNITVADGAASSAAADGGGITIAGAGANFSWDDSNSRMNLNKQLYVNANGTFETTSTDAVFKVGVTNTSSYDAKIQIAGARTASNTSNISMLEFRNSTSSAYNMAQISAMDPSANHANGRGKLFFRTSDGGTLSDQMVITHQGNIGIGSTAPVTSLNIQTAGTTTAQEVAHLRVDDTRTFGAGVGAGLQLGGTVDASGTQYVYATIRGVKENATDGNYDGAFTIATRVNGGTAATEKLRILANGNVGIGTATPAFTLHAYHASTNVISRFESGDDEVWIDLHDSGSGTYGALLGHKSSTSTLFKIADASVSEKFTILSNGNVGLGAVNPGGNLTIYNNNPNILFEDSDTTNNGEITLDNTSLRIESDPANTTADSTIKFMVDNDTKMIVLSSGNVGIGSDNPQYLLDVSGSARVTNGLTVSSSSGHTTFEIGDRSANPATGSYDFKPGMRVGSYELGGVGAAADIAFVWTTTDYTTSSEGYLAASQTYATASWSKTFTVTQRAGTRWFCKVKLNDAESGNDPRIAFNAGTEYQFEYTDAVDTLGDAVNDSDTWHVFDVTDDIVTGTNTVKAWLGSGQKTYILAMYVFASTGISLPNEPAESTFYAHDGFGVMDKQIIDKNRDMDNINTLRITGGTGLATLATDNNALNIGLSSGSNLAFDPNEIQARDNGVAADLLLQKNGGNVKIGGGSGTDELLHIEKTSGTTIVKAEVAANSVLGFETTKTGTTTQSWRIVDGQTVNGNLQIYDVTDSRLVMNFDGSGQVGVGTATNAYGRLQINQINNNDEGGIGILDNTAARSMRLWVDTTDSYVSSGNGGTGILQLNEGGGLVLISKGSTADYTANQAGVVKKTFQVHDTYDTAGTHWVAYANLDGNWLDGSTGADSQHGWIFGHSNGVRGGLIYDHRSTERMAMWSSYGPIDFMSPDAADGDGVPIDSNINERMTIEVGGDINFYGIDGGTGNNGGLQRIQSAYFVNNEDDNISTTLSEGGNGARLYFDHNFYSDQTAFSNIFSGDGGGFAYYGGDQLTWTAIYDTYNTQYAEGTWRNLKVGANQVWHAGNDGAGSGLDADNLDGVTWGNINTTLQTSSNIKAYNGTTEIKSDGIYFESSKHCITWNDGRGNFNVRVGHDTSENVTETGFASHIEWSQSSGWMQLSGTTSSRTSGTAITWTNENVWQWTFSNGEFSSPGDVVAYSSDRRLKTNITNIDNALSKVLKLNGVYFDWADDIHQRGFYGAAPGQKAVGVIAQEVEAVLPELVAPAPFDVLTDEETGEPLGSKSGEDYKTVKYEKLTALLIEAIKELSDKVDAQQQEIERLRNQS